MNNNNKVYYKVLAKDMYSPYQIFQYELNKTYSTKEELELCECGFHACKNMYELVIWASYFNLKDCRFFECTLGDKVIEDIYKVVSNSITLTKEIPYEEVDKCIRENIEVLVHDGDEDIRRAVAKQGYCLDTLINDEDWYVRAAVAGRGYGLDVLINDENPYVRASVADQGYGLDILVHDENPYVREAVAYQGYGLDILVHDINEVVRSAVADQGYGLDVLINDENPYVRASVADQGYGLDTLIHDEDWFVRASVARQRYGLDILINDKDRIVKGIRSAILDDDCIKRNYGNNQI